MHSNWGQTPSMIVRQHTRVYANLLELQIAVLGLYTLDIGQVQIQIAAHNRVPTLCSARPRKLHWKLLKNGSLACLHAAVFLVVFG